MRIIAGRFRSRVILPPEDDQTTRPITDRVKQSLFDILTPLLEESLVYDCFAGTGSMGLESISRGAKRTVFFEADRSALVRLRKNIASLQVESESSVVAGDLFRYFQTTEPPAQKASVIFLDPPYRFLKESADRLRALGERLALHLAPGGLVVFRHDAKDTLELPALAVSEVRTYGGMTLEFLSVRDTNNSSASPTREYPREPAP
jgi:16S rRNA (guanine966-N2)-methyltransferase